MNILFICDEYPPGRNGGIGTMVQVLSRELVKQGHNVFVAGLYGYRYGSPDFEMDNGVKVWRHRYGPDLGANAKNRLYNLFEKSPAIIKRHINGKGAYKRFIDFIHLLIEREKIEVIEIQDWNNFSFFIGFRVEWPHFKAPLVVKSNGSHTYFADEAGSPFDPTLHATDVALYKRADALSAVSKYTADKNRQLFNIRKEIKVLYNSIEIPGIQPGKKEAHKVIYTGTLVAKKGIFQLIKAWNLVVEKIPSAQLVIYGKGNEKAVKALLNDNSVKTVHLRGHVSREELFRELSTATAAVFPSYSECFALAPLEALTVGCPIINTSRASGKELITDGDNGSLIDPDNVNEIAVKIMELLEDRELREKYSLRGRATVLEHFNISKSADDHIVFYKQVIDDFRKKNSLSES